MMVVRRKCGHLTKWIWLMVIGQSLEACQCFQTAFPLALSSQHGSMGTLVSIDRFPSNAWIKPEHPVVTSQTRTSSVRSVVSPKGQFLKDGNNQRGRISLWKVTTRWLSRLRFCRKRLVGVAFSLFLVLSLHLGMSAGATSGYRTGGSFKSSSHSRPSLSRPSYSRPSPRQHHHHHQYHYHSSGSHFQPQRVQIVGARPLRTPWVSIYHNFSPQPGATYVRTVERPATSFSPGDVLVLTGTGALLTYGFVNTRNQRRSGPNSASVDYSPLGPGATAISVTVSMNVPDRDDPNSVLNRLEALGERVDTSTREGVQELISETSIELLRNEALITSMNVKSKHHSDPEEARKDFNAQSVENRSKYDREAVDRYGGNYLSHKASSVPSSKSSKATVAVVNLNVAIDGDSTHAPKVKSRENLIEALQRIASDARVEDCLFAAEVIWIPGDRDDSLTRDEVYQRYPNLLMV
ncbi:hypothetical protein ACA910_005812 [Epithemia clementina (nom. ined.)]